MEPARWRQLSPLLDELLELPEALRARRLAQLGEREPALAADLQRLLALEQQHEDFIATPAAGPKRAAAPPGERFGDYRLLRRLGEGAMGEVWLATALQAPDGPPVALKLLRPGLTEDGRQRLLREQDILARLAHPGIVALRDAGGADGDRPYLVLDYVDGVALTDYCAEHGLDLHARLVVFRQVCDAVLHAHRQRIVHRDLKPSNILVTADGAVRLLDFGIAGLLADATQAAEAEQQDEAVTFTLHYASPEQLRGDAPRTADDIYALGVVLYELIGGRKPYHLRRQSDAGWADAVMRANPLPPSQLPAAPRATPDVARRLDAIVMTALAKTPQARYPDVEALIADIDAELLRLASPLPAIAEVPAAATPYRRRRRRRLESWLALLLALAALLAWWHVLAGPMTAAAARVAAW